ncbi:MAG: A24 family peptidase, partial [Candidatus Omnitrophica bacterium]|nr:A24 family peptidase [Candidatus Omnitrophota bacterium]
MIEILLLTIAFIYLSITSILDIKYRLVWDYINYSFGSIFLIIRLFEAILSNSFTPFIGMALTAIATFLVGLILYKTGAWGGGDLKLLTALSIGISFLPSDYLSIASLSFPFYVNFLINTLFAGIIFGLLWSIFLIIKTKAYNEFKIRHWIFFAIGLVFFSASFFFNARIMAFLMMIAIFSLYYLAKLFENKISIIDKDAKRLDEGDWILKDMKVNGKTITKKPTGLSKEDIKIIQASKLKTIKIKDGIPFLCSFFLSFIITIILNDNL